MTLSDREICICNNTLRPEVVRCGRERGSGWDFYHVVV